MVNSHNSSFERQAAVLIAIAEGSGRGEEILLTLRAPHLNQHGGEVAFPGGKWEPGDTDLQATALRESYEEVGLPVSDVDVIGKMDSSYTRQGTEVTPYIGRVYTQAELKANPNELSALFWFPIRLLQEDQRIRTDIFEYMGREFWAPVYKFQEFTIWGFTSRVLVQFLKSYCGITLERSHSAPELRFKPKL